MFIIGDHVDRDNYQALDFLFVRLPTYESLFLPVFDMYIFLWI